jgi:iron-sulfur cluster assembly protein
MAHQVITLTDAAAERARALMVRSEKPVAALRVGVKARGCSGSSEFRRSRPWPIR